LQELSWLERFPDGKIEGCFDLLDKIYWHIDVRDHDGTWSVYAGESLIFHTDNRDCLDAFLYGMGLTYVVLPQTVFEKLREEIRKWVE
jgi:hypothetical protein